MFISYSIMELFGLNESQIRNRLSENEKKEIHKYSNKNNRIYKNMNFKLRNHLQLNNAENKLYNSLNESILKFELQSQITLFRGMNIDCNFYNHLLSQIGKYEMLKGVVSTSYNLEVSKDKYTKGNNIPIIFIITVSKGANCIPTFLFAEDKSEEEITFINLKMLINKVYTQDGITYFEATC